MLTGADLRVWHWKDNHLERKRGLLRERRRCAGQKEPSHLRFEPGVRCTVTDNAWQPDIKNHVLHNSYLSFLRLPFQPFSILTLKHLVRLQEHCSIYMIFLLHYFYYLFFFKKKGSSSLHSLILTFHRVLSMTCFFFYIRDRLLRLVSYCASFIFFSVRHCLLFSRLCSICYLAVSPLSPAEGLCELAWSYSLVQHIKWPHLSLNFIPSFFK